MKQRIRVNSGAVRTEQMLGSMACENADKIPLKAVSIKGSINGLLFSWLIRQEYMNESDRAQEIIYTFPVPWQTALLGLDAENGAKKLQGLVVERQEAEETYEKALEKGDSTIMVEESSAGLYTANLGNIAPGEKVAIEIHCARLLAYEQGRIRVCIPTVIGERYGDPHGPGALAPHESAAVDKSAHYSFDINLALHGQLADAEIEAPGHAINKEKKENVINISLAESACLDRDFVLTITGLDGKSLAMFARDSDKWLASASFCPKMPQRKNDPVALKILVDCSGSMHGSSIEQARRGLEGVIRGLESRDYISFSRFGSGVEHFDNKLLPCTETNIKKIAACLERLDADLGGTEMEGALESTVRDIAVPENVNADILLITDGDVWNVRGVVRAAKSSGHRVFVIGVGSAPAEALLREMAEDTGGACELVTPDESMPDAIVRMFHRMRGKTAKNISIDWGQKTIWQADLPHCVHDGETIHSFALFVARPECAPVLEWEAGSERHQDRAELAACDIPTLVRLGRRVQMLESDSPKEQMELALAYQLLGSRTALILVYERPEDGKLEGVPQVCQVPQMPAHGHGCYLNAFANAAVPMGGRKFSAKMFYDYSLDFCDIESLLGHKHKVERLDASPLLAAWKTTLFNLASIDEFVSFIETQPEYGSLIAFVRDLARERFLSETIIWAALLIWLFGENAESPDRHSLRLLRTHKLPNGIDLNEIFAQRLDMNAA